MTTYKYVIEVYYINGPLAWEWETEDKEKWLNDADKLLQWGYQIAMLDDSNGQWHLSYTNCRAADKYYHGHYTATKRK